MIVVQDFETVTFYVLFVYKPTFSVIFCGMKRLGISSQFNSLFILYISTAKPFSLLVRGYIAVKTNFEMSKIYQGNFQSSCRLAQFFSGVLLQKRAKSLEKIFFLLWKCNLVGFIEYQEIDVQIETFMDENWNIPHNYIF